MADGIILEQSGLPTVLICTDAFSASADAMADLRGAPVAREFGADHTIVVDGDNAVDTVQRVEEITNGEMADVTLELTPPAAALVSDAL